MNPEAEKLATDVAEAACRLQDAIAAAEKAGLQVGVTSDALTTYSFAPADGQGFHGGSGYEQTRTSINVKTSLVLSMGGK